MAKGKSKKKKLVKKKNSNDDHSFYFKTRRSSMRVNLSYVSNLSDSEQSLLKNSSIENSESISEELLYHNYDIFKIMKNCQAKRLSANDITTDLSTTNVTVIRNGSSCFLDDNNKESDKIQNNLLMDIKEKEQQLNKSCMQLKDAIMSKTKALFDKENELAIKTSEVLTAGCTSSTNKVLSGSDKRSPSVKVNIGKNDQIIMSGDGRKQNPVQVNSMLNRHSVNKELITPLRKMNKDYVNYNQRIVSTPKKSKTESCSNKKEFYNKISPTILRIPVTRLFNDDNSSNNSISTINSVCSLNRPKITIKINNETSSNNVNNVHETSHELNCTSPILSQGIRSSRLSCLSLKKKFTKKLTEISSKFSSSITSEKFCNKNMVPCSSFIDKQDQMNNENDKNEICRIRNLNKNNKVDKCNIVDLADNTSFSKTIDNSNNTNQLCMELTTISSCVPIIQRSFQQVISKSLLFDNVVNNCDKEIKNSNSTIQNQIPFIITRTFNKDDCNLESDEETQNDNVNRNISLNVNTSLDEIKLTNPVTQKENKIPNNTENKLTKNNKNQIEEDIRIIQQDTFSIPSSTRVCNSFNLRKKSSVPNTINEKLEESGRIISLKSDININQENQNNDRIISRQPSTSTIRSSLQVNTSLDSCRKSPVTKTVLDFNKLLSVVMETSSNNNQSKVSTHNSKEQFLDSDSELENVSLMERIKNISTIKSTENKKKCEVIKNVLQKSIEIINDSNSFNKSIENNDNNLSTNNLSVIESTPYPTSRSVLLKTIIKNNIAMNTIDPRMLIEISDSEDYNEFQSVFTKKVISTKKNQSPYARKKILSDVSSDTVILNSSESSNELDREERLVIIDESLNETNNFSIIKSDQRFINKQKNKKMVGKRKLYPLRENSQLISFTPTETKQSPKKIEYQNKVKRNRKVCEKKNQQKKVIEKCPNSNNKGHPLENNILSKQVEKKKRKPKKIISKKIVVKKVTNMTILENMMKNEEKLSQRLNDRSSLKEFDLKSMKGHQKEDYRRNHKIIIVVTGLAKEERDLVRSVIKALGSASLEINVTLRTTHVISSGIRTINLLKGIIRGCWLLNLEWALKSLENERWLDPSPYEMSHFSKAVQENRRDRQLFGKAYVPELFVTCGIIYIENGTSPPASSLKELVKIAGGRITENPSQAEIVIGSEGLREIWILDSITTGEVQCINQYKRN